MTLPDNSIVTSTLNRASLNWRIGQARSISTTGYSRVRVYGIKIYDGDTLVLDCIPVRDTNNLARLYDKVNKIFMYNTGTLKAGPEKKGE